MRLAAASLFALFLLALTAPVASAEPVAGVPGADWSQAEIESTGGVKLHADVLRPANLPKDAKTPVIVSIGPYFNHSGEVGAAGPVEDASYDPIGPATSPSGRFFDLVNGAKLMQRGYTFVMVDLRGFGGSTGCLDWGGPGEQADVVSAVEWAADQPWSTGKVGMYGKSYDAVTGLIGVNKRPRGLSAVVSQEPLYDLYRYLYGDGIRRVNSVATPALYNLIAITPGPVLGGGNYNIAAAQSANPDCHILNQLSQTGDDRHDSAYWKQRTLIDGVKGSNVPLFLAQGLTENNTVADGMAQYLDNHTGYEQGWLGPWEHVRGNETDEAGRLKMGRAGWFDETMRFYDRFLKGVEPTVRDPRWAIQTNDGKWSAAASWKPADATDRTSALKPGAYTDDGDGYATGSGSSDGIWTVSSPVATEAHLAGSGKVTLDVTKPALGSGNLVVDVYDLSEAANGDLEGPLITRQGYLVRQSGPVSLDLWSADWKIAPGHRIGVRITDANGDWWLHTGTMQDVTVNSASITLPFLGVKRNQAIQGDPGVQLETYLGEKATLPKAQVAAAESPAFALPPAQAEPSAAENDAAFTSVATAAGAQGGSAGGGTSTASGTAGSKARVKLGRFIGRKRIAEVRVYGPGTVTVTARRGKRAVAVGRKTVKRAGVYRIRLRATKAGKRLLAKRSVRRKGTRVSLTARFGAAGASAATAQQTRKVRFIRMR